MEKSYPLLRTATSKPPPIQARRLSGPPRLAVASTTLSIEPPALCSYARHTCMRNRLEDYEFCSRHILEDKTTPYRQCVYTNNKTGRRCLEAVLKTDRRDGFCTEHAHKMLMARKQNGAKKPKPTETPHSLLAEIECHLGTASKPSSSKHSDSLMHSHSLANDTSSGSEDEMSSHLMHNMLTCHDDLESDAESIDSEQENALKHAGVYTAEEVALIFRDKLIRLQSLYIDQFKRLHHRLREKRRNYLHTVRSLPSASSSESTVDDINSKAMNDKLSALRRYHRRFGKEALLMRQLKERRLAVYEGELYKAPAFVTCEHVTDGVSCTSRVLPLSKYCQQHILSDAQQVLYTDCGYGGACQQPALVVSSNPKCRLHIQMDSFECRYSQREHDDSREESVDVVNVTEEFDDTV